MRNLSGTIFYMKTNVLQNFYICISIPLIDDTVGLKVGISDFSILLSASLLMNFSCTILKTVQKPRASVLMRLYD